LELTRLRATCLNAGTFGIRIEIRKRASWNVAGRWTRILTYTRLGALQELQRVIERELEEGLINPYQTSPTLPNIPSVAIPPIEPQPPNRDPKTTIIEAFLLVVGYAADKHLHSKASDTIIGVTTVYHDLELHTGDKNDFDVFKGIQQKYYPQKKNTKN